MPNRIIVPSNVASAWKIMIPSSFMITTHKIILAPASQARTGHALSEAPAEYFWKTNKLYPFAFTRQQISVVSATK